MFNCAVVLNNTMVWDSRPTKHFKNLFHIYYFINNVLRLNHPIKSNSELESKCSFASSLMINLSIVGVFFYEIKPGVLGIKAEIKQIHLNY